MRRSLQFLAAAALLVPVAATAAPLMAGKHETDRTVTCDVTVDASPAEVYRLWTTEAGVKRFFAPEAHIDAWPGGRYEILFAPDRDPRGLSHGTAGARLLKLEPGRLVAFEWIAFAADSTLGRNAPPIAPPSLRNESPLPTWVEVWFDALPDGRTHVTLRHLGFRHGELWDRSFAFFGRVWPAVLRALEVSCRMSALDGAEVQ